MNNDRLASMPTRWQQVALFARNFFKHPAMLGSLIPSSRFLIDQVLQHVDWDRARVFVEYGPGVGTFTREILERMHPDARLIGLELNRDFATFLAESIHDPRFRVVHGSASEVKQALADEDLHAADYVLSGIPFTTIPAEIRETILADTREVLGDHGRFLVYQFTRNVLPYLKESFDEVEREFEPLNVLPAFVFSCGANGKSHPGK